MRTNLEDNLARSLRQQSAKYGVATLQMVGDYRVLPDGPTYHFLDPNGSNRNVFLPPILQSWAQQYWITHTGSANQITIKDDGGTTLTTLGSGQAGICFSSKDGWRVIIAGDTFGDVVGDSTAVANDLVMYAGTTGKHITDSGYNKTILDGAALTKVDDTNVTLTLGGSPTTALLRSASLTLGWTGTLAAGRLNSNVVQSVVNDTNVTGSISAQALTLGWTGTLALSRLAQGTDGQLIVGQTSAAPQYKTMIGDAALSAGGSLTIGNNAVTYAKMQDVTAASKLLGRGDSGSGDPQEITLGSGLSMSGTTLSVSAAGTGDVVGPSSATDNAIARFDTTTGKLIQNSVVLIDDTTGTTHLGTNDSGALGTGTLSWSDLFLASGAVINFNNGNYTITHSAGLLTTNGNLSLTTSGVLTAGTIELGAASDTTISRQSAGHLAVEGNTIWDAANDGSGSGLDADLLDGKNTGTSGNVVPLLDGANTWSALQIMTLGSGAANEPLRLINTTDNASVQVLELQGDRATMAANDEAYVSYVLSDSAGNQDEFARLTWRGVDVTSTSNDARLSWSVAIADVLTAKIQLEGSVFAPAASDGTALGSGTLMWADLFLASGGVINFNNGNYTITHSAGLLTTNGNLSLTTSGVLTTGTIELGASSDTTLSRASAGVLAVEGVNVLTTATGQPLDATLTALAGLTITQGSLIYGTGTDAFAVLAKDTNATRYLSNTGATNNPAWAQIDLTNGVTGDLPFANLTQGSARSVLGVTGNSTADVASIQGTADQVLVVNGAGTALAFGTVATGGIANNAVTYAKIQDVTATNRFLGRITAGAGDPEELTGTQATTLLDVFTSALKGLAPASGGGTANFLRADGTWAAPVAAASIIIGSSTITSGTDKRILFDDSGVVGENADLTWDKTNNILTLGGDVQLLREATNVLAQRNSTTAQVSRIYNTYTDASNWERFSIDWTASANYVYLQTEKAGTGTQRAMVFNAGKDGGNFTHYWKYAGTDLMWMRTDGTLFTTTFNLIDDAAALYDGGNQGLYINKTAGVLWSNGTAWWDGTAWIEARYISAGMLGLHRTDNSGAAAASTGAVGLSVYNTIDNPNSPANWERGVFDWTTSANVLTIGTQKAGTGATRGINFDVGGVTVTTLVSAGMSIGGALNVSQTDAQIGFLLHGSVAGVRITPYAGGVGTLIEGVDNTGSISYQPLQIGGSLVQLNTGGVNRWQVSGAGHFVANADNTYDIGTSTDFRPRNVYVAGALVQDQSFEGKKVFSNSNLILPDGYEDKIRTRLTLGGTARATAQTTGQITLFDQTDDWTVGVPKSGSFIVPDNFFYNGPSQLSLRRNERATLKGSANMALTDDSWVGSRVVLRG